MASKWIHRINFKMETFQIKFASGIFSITFTAELQAWVSQWYFNNTLSAALPKWLYQWHVYNDFHEGLTHFQNETHNGIAKIIVSSAVCPKLISPCLQQQHYLYNGFHKCKWYSRQHFQCEFQNGTSQMIGTAVFPKWCWQWHCQNCCQSMWFQTIVRAAVVNWLHNCTSTWHARQHF